MKILITLLMVTLSTTSAYAWDDDDDNSKPKPPVVTSTPYKGDAGMHVLGYTAVGAAFEVRLAHVGLYLSTTAFCGTDYLM